MKHTSAHSQHGGAALIVTLLLFLAMALAAFALNRHLVFEQRSAANQARATQAFEAAEAGLEWAQAQLNSTQRIGPDCRPSTDAAASSFRARLLSLDRGTGRVTAAALRCSNTRWRLRAKAASAIARNSSSVTISAAPPCWEWAGVCFIVGLRDCSCRPPHRCEFAPGCARCGSRVHR